MPTTHDHPLWAHEVAYGPCTLPVRYTCRTCGRVIHRARGVWRHQS